MSMTTASSSSSMLTSKGQSDSRGGHFSLNVGETERQISLVAGGVLTLLGLSRKSLGGVAVAAAGGSLLYRGLTGHCGIYSKLRVNTANTEPTSPEEYHKRGIHAVAGFTINKPRAELFAFWRDFNNLPKFMKHLKSVQVQDGKRSHWVAEGPVGMTLAWDAEIINEEPDSLIAWRSLPGGDIDSAGSVRFLDGPTDRGTEVKVVVDYIPPMGRFGATISWLLGHGGETQVREDLRRFKSMMEAGEIPTIDGQPKGSC